LLNGQVVTTDNYMKREVHIATARNISVYQFCVQPTIFPCIRDLLSKNLAPCLKNQRKWMEVLCSYVARQWLTKLGSLLQPHAAPSWSTCITPKWDPSAGFCQLMQNVTKVSLNLVATLNG